MKINPTRRVVVTVMLLSALLLAMHSIAQTSPGRSASTKPNQVPDGDPAARIAELQRKLDAAPAGSPERMRVAQQIMELKTQANKSRTDQTRSNEPESSRQQSELDEASNFTNDLLQAQIDEVLSLTSEAIDRVMLDGGDGASDAMATASTISRMKARERDKESYKKWLAAVNQKGLQFISLLQPRSVALNYADFNGAEAQKDAAKNRADIAALHRQENKDKIQYDFMAELRKQAYFRPYVELKLQTLVAEDAVRMDFDVPGSFAAFSTSVSIKEGSDSIQFSVLLDDKIAWKSKLPIVDRMPQRCVLNMRGVKKLTLLTEWAGLKREDGFSRYGKTTSWINPVMIRRLSATPTTKPSPKNAKP